MRTSFHHQPEAQHPNFPLSVSRQARLPHLTALICRAGTSAARLAGTTVASLSLAPVRVCAGGQGGGFGAPAGLIYCTEQSLATGEKRGNRG
jgi:hypothetical protein